LPLLAQIALYLINFSSYLFATVSIYGDKML
jgi:hypothetical protein